MAFVFHNVVNISIANAYFSKTESGTVNIHPNKPNPEDHAQPNPATVNPDAQSNPATVDPDALPDPATVDPDGQSGSTAANVEEGTDVSEPEAKKLKK